MTLFLYLWTLANCKIFNLFDILWIIESIFNLVSLFQFFRWDSKSCKNSFFPLLFGSFRKFYFWWSLWIEKIFLNFVWFFISFSDPPSKYFFFIIFSLWCWWMINCSHWLFKSFLFLFLIWSFSSIRIFKQIIGSHRFW